MEAPSRLKLVVRCEQRPQPVQDVDPVGFEPSDLPDPRLDPVQARQDVEPGQCGVIGPEQAKRPCGRHDHELDSLRSGFDEPQVRLVVAVGDEGDLHLTQCACSEG